MPTGAAVSRGQRWMPASEWQSVLSDVWLSPEARCPQAAGCRLKRKLAAQDQILIQKNYVIQK